MGPEAFGLPLFHDPVLEQEVRRVARKRDGLVLIPEPGQLLMMASLRMPSPATTGRPIPRLLRGAPWRKTR